MGDISLYWALALEMGFPYLSQKSKAIKLKFKKISKKGKAYVMVYSNSSQHMGPIGIGPT